MKKIKKEMIKKTKGISLMPLITIIILLVLAGVTINLLEREKYKESEVKEKVELLLNEYRTKQQVGKKDNFVDFLEKNLKVNVIQNQDNTYYFIWKGYQVKTNVSKIISIDEFELKADKTYNSVEAMKKDTNLKAGEIAYTESYYSSTYGGNAYYQILKNTNLTVDNGKCILLGNGLYASLLITNDTVNVHQFGAYGDGIHDDSQAINLAINSSFPNIQFEAKQYKINKRIDIVNSNITILGNNATIFYDNEFIFNDDYIIRVYSDREYVKNVRIENLSVMDKNTIRAEEKLMVKIMYAENISLFNCNLKADYIEENTNRSVTNIDLRGYWKDINISECNLINTTHGPSGGTIWIRAGQEGTGNLNMKNNYIEKSCRDETIAIFGKGVIDNVNIENNTFNIDDSELLSKSYPVINFGLATDRTQDIKFINNNVKIKANGGFIVIYNATNVLIANNKMDIMSLNDNPSGYFSAENSSNVEFVNNDINLIHNKINLLDEIFFNIDKINNNNFTINVDFLSFVTNTYEFCNNTVNLEGTISTGVSSIFYMRNQTLQKDILIKNNIFNINANIENEIRFVNFYQSYIDNYKINIIENTINEAEEKASPKKYAVYFQNMKDATPQEIYVGNNNFGNYGKVGRWNNATTYDIMERIEKSVIDIKIQKIPTKTSYIQNQEKLDLTGGKLQITYNDNTIEEIDMTDEGVMVEGFNNKILGTQIITISYKEIKSQFHIEVREEKQQNVENKIIKKVEIKILPKKTQYVQKENIDLSGGILLVEYEDGSIEEIPMTSPDIIINEFDNTILGEQKITIEYKNKKVTLEVIVVEENIEQIEIKTNPYKIKYVQNEEPIDLTGGVLLITYDDKTTKEIEINDKNVEVEGFDNSTLGEKTIQIKYGGKMTTYTVSITEKMKDTTVATKKLPMAGIKIVIIAIIGILLFNGVISGKNYIGYLKDIHKQLKK